jgi:hypothetical protein
VRALASTLLVLSLAACTPEICERENLPAGGDPATVEQLFQVAQHAARNDCCDALYGLLSPRTREEHGETKFCLFWKSLDVPDPWNYKVVDVVAKGTYLATMKDLEQRELMYVQYAEPGKPDLVVQLLIVREGGRPRLGLQDQQDQNIPIAQPPD